MTAAELKASILDLAVRGQLVPQREEERFEKFEGFEKFERFEKSTVDDPPYELPRNWVWKRLGEVGRWRSGSTPSKSNNAYYKDGDIPWLVTGDLNDSDITDIPGKITPLALNETSVKLNPPGSVLIAMYGATIGKVGILKIAATTNQACCACQPLDSIYNKYLFYYLMSHRSAFQKRGEGGAQPNISKEKIIETSIPLPPLPEQKRIVAKIEELLPLVEEYGAVQKELEALNADFPAALRESILQDAMQGKLTAEWRRARFEKFETARELLDQIAAEKKRLLATKKIKKEKPLPPITDDEKPFEIPDTWAWCRFCNLVDEVSTGPFGSMLHKKDYVSNGIPIVNPANIVNETIVPSCKMMVSEETRNRLSSYRLEKGMIVMARRGEMGRCAMVTGKEDGWLCGTGSFFMHLLGGVDGRYLIKFFATPHAKKVLGGESVGTTMSNLNHGILSGLLIPLPPLAEQKAIVERVDELLKIVDAMKAQ